MHATPVTTLLVSGVRGMRSSARGGAGPKSSHSPENFGQGLAPSDNQMIFESVARLNAVGPSKVGQSDSWSNPETKSSGNSNHTSGVPLGWHGLPSDAPSDCRRKATASLGAGRRMEDKELTQPRSGCFFWRSRWLAAVFGSTMALVPRSDYGGMRRALAPEVRAR
jgi:hypothetical protein